MMNRFILDRNRRTSSEVTTASADFGPVVPMFHSNEPGRRAHLSAASQSPSRSGRIREELASNAGGVSFYSYTPRSVSRAPRHSLLVTVHGISRNAHEHVETFASACNQLGWYVVAPLYSAETHPKYQQLGFSDKCRGPRPDPPSR